MPEIVYRLSAAAAVERRGQSLCFTREGEEFSSITPRSDAVGRLVYKLSDGVSEEEIEALTATDVAGCFFILEKITASGLLDHVWRKDHREHVVFRPNKGQFSTDLSAMPGAARLSRLAYLRPGDDGLVLQTADKGCDARFLTRQGLGWLHDLLNGEAPEGSAELREVLWRYRFLEVDKNTLDGACWEFHDALFHKASRGGNDRGVRGGTYRFKDQYPAPTVSVDGEFTNSIGLPSPEQGEGPHNKFEDVLTARHSDRNHDNDNPITLQQLSSFLWRTVRFTGQSAEGVPSRPFPSGGSIHELEFYVVVRLCQGLEAGLYHYNGWRHRLEQVNGEQVVAGFIEDAARCWGAPDKLAQVLIIFSSRMPRVAWKYEGVAYRLTVLNAGVAMQTMYLVATDMNLAATALGLGNVDRFAAATLLDPNSETSVAEFALGSKRQEFTV